MDGLSPDKTRLCLTRSITKLQHLETLQLDLANVPDNSKLLGDGGGLDLSSLTRLSEADISFRLFVFNKITTRSGSKYDPALFLPQSLEKLGIMVRGYKCEAGSDLKNFLNGLQKASKYGFPTPEAGPIQACYWIPRSPDCRARPHLCMRQQPPRGLLSLRPQLKHDFLFSAMVSHQGSPKPPWKVSPVGHQAHEGDNNRMDCD